MLAALGFLWKLLGPIITPILGDLVKMMFVPKQTIVTETTAYAPLQQAEQPVLSRSVLRESVLRSGVQLA